MVTTTPWRQADAGRWDRGGAQRRSQRLRSERAGATIPLAILAMNPGVDRPRRWVNVQTESKICLHLSRMYRRLIRDRSSPIMPSSLGLEWPVCISFIVFESSACRFGSSRVVSGSAVPGIGTAILERVSIPRVTATAIRSRKNCSKNGSGVSIFPRNRKPCATSMSWRTSSTYARTSSSTAAPGDLLLRGLQPG